MIALRNPPAWVAWILPLGLFHLTTRLSLAVQHTPGTALWYLPVPLGIILIHLWGPRILPALYANAVISCGLWKLPNYWLWPLYAWPETLEVFLSWFLFHRIGKGNPALPDTRELSKFLVLGLLVPISIGSIAIPVQLAALGDLSPDRILETVRIGLPGDLAASVALTLPGIIGLFHPRQTLFSSSLHPISLLILALLCVSGGILLPTTDSWWFFALILAFVATTSGIGYTLLFNLIVLLIALFYPLINASWITDSAAAKRIADLYLGMSVLASTNLLISRSIADLRQEIHRRQEAERRNRAFIESNPDLLFMLNENGFFLDVRGNTPHSEQRPDTFIGRHISEVLSPEIASLMQQAMQEAREKSRPAHFVYTLRFEALHYYEARLICYAQDYLIFVRDITEQKIVEQENQRLISELKKRNQEMERFTYSVSHDLKSPLVTIRGFLRMIEEDFQSGNHQDIPEHLARIEKAALRMSSLLSDLLQLSRVGRVGNPPSWNSLPEMIRETCDLLDGILKKSAATVEVRTGDIELFGDRSRLLEVLQNAIENAIKYRHPQRTPHLVFFTRQEEDRLICAIRDNGIGIEPRYLQQIFGLFSKLNPHTEGTGIGLAMIKRIIEHHGGEAWMESDGPDQGSTLCFWLPGYRIGTTANLTA